MHTSLLIMMSWPLVLTGLGTLFLTNRLKRPGAFFLRGLTLCVALEIALGFGLLPIVAGFDLFGFLFQLSLGTIILFILYRRDHGRPA